MFDVIYVISTGGRILLRKSFEEETHASSRAKELAQFIKEAFLSQKPQGDRLMRIDNSIYRYVYEREKGLIFACVFADSISGWNFGQFLETYAKDFDPAEPKEKMLASLEALLHSFKFVEESKVAEKPKKEAQKKVEEPKPKTEKQKKNKLDYSAGSSGSEVAEQKMRENFISSASDKADSFIDDSEPEENVNVEKPSLFAKFKSSISNIKEGKPLQESIKPILENFKNALIEKNVGEEVARKICTALEEKMLSQRASLFASAKNIVKEALREVMAQILTPKTHIDLISLALKRREEGRPLVITFVGVNGVGKSTNLAKVAYYFKTNGFSVLLAACDNFRAGAVEQIKTHGKCLEIPVYDRAYKDDPANIAHDAIQEAKARRIEVVLVDTAGRMQDNEPLMKALARLVNLNNPDVVLFIGEALAGNDVIDQLTKFNASLMNYSASSESQGRQIDGILLSKFDTVDEKVGAALSLTYITGKPILFVGVGQKYPDLKVLNIDSVVNNLLK